jgi:hypothetical protein
MVVRTPAIEETSQLFHLTQFHSDRQLVSLPSGIIEY